MSTVWRRAPGTPYGASHQTHVLASSRGWRVSLESWSRCQRSARGECYFFVAARAADHKTLHFRVANLTSQVDSASIVGTDEVAVLGRASPNLSVITLVALPSGREIDSFVCFRPVISPSLRYIAYVKWFPAHIGHGYTVTSEYMVYSLAALPAANRPNGLPPSDVYDVGWPVYPVGARNAPGDTMLEGNNEPAHVLVSQAFFWLADNAVAFVDRWHDVNTLIVADLSGGIRHPRVVARPIQASRLADFPSCLGSVAPSDLARWRRSPGTLLYVQNIRKVTGKPGWVQLTLQPNECLTTTALDIPISPGAEH